MSPDILLLLAVVSGFLAGLLIGLAAWHRTRSASRIEREELKIRIATLEKEREADVEKLKWTEQAESKMRAAFAALACEALKDNSEALSRQAGSNFKSLVDPLKENLTSLDGYVRELERARKGAYESLKQQLSQLDATHARLQKTTTPRGIYTDQFDYVQYP